MASKAAFLPVVSSHIHTLRRSGETKPRLRDLALHYGMPMFVGALVALLGFRMTDGGQIIEGSAILAAFAFGVAVFVFQLRLEAARDPRIDKGAYLLELLDELFANVLYLIVWGLLVVGLAITATSFTRPDESATAGKPALEEALSGWWTALLVFASLHYLVTLLMCVKRLRRAYAELTI